MIQSVVLVGANGSMGRRYQAILKHLGILVRCVDTPGSISKSVRWWLDGARDGSTDPDADAVILASPTDTHAAYIRDLALLGKPILCEKPLSRDLAEVDELLRAPGPLDMMTQYALLDGEHTGNAETVYDFYHTGSDGLAWDCMQLIGLARGPLSITAESPVWRCLLNGRVLSLDDVGRAYVDYVQRWLEHPEGDRAQMRRLHERAAQWRPA